MTETKVSKKPEVQNAHLICRKNRNVILSYWFSKMETVSVLKNTKITRKEVHKPTMASKPINATRAPDCVTEVRMGNTVLTVSGYFKENATETAADKMEKVLKAEEFKLLLDAGQAN